MPEKETQSPPIDLFVSIVLVADERTTGLKAELEALSAILRKNYVNYEIVLVDNYMSKTELQAASSLLDRLPCIRIVRLSQPHTTDVCIFAGLEAAIGDIVTIKTMHDPVELITEFVAAARDHDIVYGISKRRVRAGLLNRYGARLFYWYSRTFLKISIPESATYFMALDRRAVNALTQNNRFARHIRYMARKIGYSYKEIRYAPRSAAQPERKRVTALFASAVDLSVHYSNRPLRFLAWLGFFGSFLNLLYALYVVLVRIFKNNVAEGWTTLSIQSATMFFLMFGILAFMCEYLGKILQQSQGEPPYHIAEERNSKISVADATRLNITG